jgi:hypothetical protein
VTIGDLDLNLDTGWTLAAKSKNKTDAKKESAETAPLVSPSHKSNSDSSDNWTIEA